MNSPTSVLNDPSPATPVVESHTWPQSIKFEREISGLRGWRQNRKSRQNPPQDWNRQQPYHEYIHRLIAAGWDNLQALDTYMNGVAVQDPGLIVSIVDIARDLKTKRWPDITNESDLVKFLDSPNREGAHVRLYSVEYSDKPSSGIIEAFGSTLKLDPRFFSWAIRSEGHVFTASYRYRAPYVTVRFGILDATTSSTTDTENFDVLVYIQPDKEGSGWTGVMFFSSHTRVNLSYRINTDPPPFTDPLPSSTTREPKSFRELYIESLESISIPYLVSSPFYAISSLLRMNCFCWNQIITTVREEDRRINGISSTSVGHAEEIRKNLHLVQRFGSLGWIGRDDEMTKETQKELEEDFKHLVDQTDLLWQTREKMKTVRERKSEMRWTSLTNAFTYLFAPVTIISGIYGMNVSEISGSSSNPDIWQFFVAVAGLNLLVLLCLAVSSWIHIQIKHGRKAGVKEILGIAFGKIG